MNCVLFAKGSKRGYGHPVQDKKAPLIDFLVDNSVYYSLVLQHLRGSPKDKKAPCTACDPTEILQHYLDRRLRDPKFKGQTSRSLMENAERYGRLKGRNVPPALIRQFAVRSGDAETIGRYAPRMTEDELVKSMLILRAQYTVHRQQHGFKISDLDAVRRNELLYAVGLAIDHMKDPEGDVSKIIEMAGVALVLHT